jgi:hypothetical protein
MCPDVACRPSFAELPNGSVEVSLTLSTPQAYAEAFIRDGSTQVAAGNVAPAGVANFDGTVTYSHTVPASAFKTGNSVTFRWYSYIAGHPGVFTPGPTASTWFPGFTYGVPPTSDCSPRVEFDVQTGHDDLRSDSELDAVMKGTDGSSQTIVLRPANGLVWPNGSSHSGTFGLTLSSPVSNIELVLVESDPGCGLFCDNWDMANLAITSLNVDGSQTCLAHLRGANGGLDNDPDAVARLTRDQNTVLFTAGQGCP